MTLRGVWVYITLRVQVLNHKVSTPNHNDDSEYGNPKYPMVRYFGPLGDLGEWLGPWNGGSRRADVLDT